MVVYASGGTLTCCGKPMELQKEKSDDTGKEKHVPVIKKSARGVQVEVGSVPHPMEEKHYIEWIEVTSGQNLSVVGLKPGDRPEAEFCTPDTNSRVRAYCNVHGLWTNKL
jgi:superoxide reductase